MLPNRLYQTADQVISRYSQFSFFCVVVGTCIDRENVRPTFPRHTYMALVADT